MIDTNAIQARFNALGPFLNERDRRLFAASEARAAGHGGIAAVSRTTGIARSTIGRGMADLRSGAVRCSERVRRRGGGKKSAIETQPGILEALNDLVEPSIRGDPEAPLRWVSLSQRHLSAALAKRGFIAGQKLVGRLLKRLDFSLQANCKTREGASHPDRNAQFEHINAEVQAFQAAGQPVISVDTKKKEPVGDFKNGGRELRPRGSRSRSGCMTSPFPNSARPCRTGSTTFPPMPVSSMSASAPTPESSPSKRLPRVARAQANAGSPASDAGGTRSAPRVIQMRSGC